MVWTRSRDHREGSVQLALRPQPQLWVATEVGLFVANAPFQRFARVAELPPRRFWAVVEGSDGTLWAGGTGGLFEYSNGRWKNLTRANGLSNQEVLSLGAGPQGASGLAIVLAAASIASLPGGTRRSSRKACKGRAATGWSTS